MWEDAPEDSGEEAPIVTVSKDSLGGKNCLPGDTITFTVVSADEGEVGMRMSGYEHKGGGEMGGEYSPEMETETA